MVFPLNLGEKQGDDPKRGSPGKRGCEGKKRGWYGNAVSTPGVSGKI
jgi:hypothetical protein